MTGSDNIIDFSSRLAKKDTESFKEIVEKEEDLLYEIVETSIGMTVDILDTLSEMGYQCKDVKYQSDIFLLVEAIKSLMHKSIDKEFPMQQIANSLFQEVEIEPEAFDDIFT